MHQNQIVWDVCVVPKHGAVQGRMLCSCLFPSPTMQPVGQFSAKHLAGSLTIYCNVKHLQEQEIFSLLPLPGRCDNLVFCILLQCLSSHILVQYTSSDPCPHFFFFKAILVTSTNKQWMVLVSKDSDTGFRTETSYQDTWKLMSIFKMKTNMQVQMVPLKNKINDNF